MISRAVEIFLSTSRMRQLSYSVICASSWGGEMESVPLYVG